MKCPKCWKKMKQRKVRDVTVEVCPECMGVWFDKKELETLSSLAVRDLAVLWNAKKTGLRCPRCFKLLSSFEYPQTMVTVEMCKNCDGLWLDAGEYEEIAAVRRALEQAGELDKAMPPAGIKGGLINFINVAIEALKTG